jgi:D-ribose pyranose/furanose isomerase RbsD
MKLLSIDVGIKNLALCLFDVDDSKKYEILNWDVINLCNEIDIKCFICDKTAKFMNKETYCCKKHITNTGLVLIDKELEMKQLKKTNVNNIKEIFKKHHIEFNSKQSKVLLLDSFEKQIPEKYVIPFSNKVNCNDLNLIEIGINLKNKLNQLYENIKIDKVIIENQISPIANRMKTLQGMIAQYFILNDVIDIQFISASNKLKDYISTKTTYLERKYKGIEICEEILINNEDICKYLFMFNNHKKKDDLADCFLQGVWFLKNK